MAGAGWHRMGGLDGAQCLGCRDIGMLRLKVQASKQASQHARDSRWGVPEGGSRRALADPSTLPHAARDAGCTTHDADAFAVGLHLGSSRVARPANFVRTPSTLVPQHASALGRAEWVAARGWKYSE